MGEGDWLGARIRCRPQLHGMTSSPLGAYCLPTAYAVRESQ